jgi:hypothetical protein
MARQLFLGFMLKPSLDMTFAIPSPVRRTPGKVVRILYATDSFTRGK